MIFRPFPRLDLLSTVHHGKFYAIRDDIADERAVARYPAMIFIITAPVFTSKQEYSTLIDPCYLRQVPPYLKRLQLSRDFSEVVKGSRLHITIALNFLSMILMTLKQLFRTLCSRVKFKVCRSQCLQDQLKSTPIIGK